MIAKRSGDKRLDIYRSTTGMLFFGTPFRGAGGLTQAGILQAIQSQYKEEQIQGSNLNILTPGNESLIDLMDEFSETRTERNIARVACFYEQKPSNVGAIYKRPRLQVSKLIFLQMRLTVYSNSWWMKLQGAWIKANRQRNTLFPEIISI